MRPMAASAPPTRPILVTGSHRSGTTWVGRMIAASPGVGYIHEPFNLGTSRGVCRAPLRYWFTRVGPKDEDRFLGPLRDTISFRYSLGGAAREIRSWRDARARWSELRRFRRLRGSGVRPVVKDPIALLSAEWLASRFDMDVVVMIRHPGAFVRSLKRLNWNYPFSHLLEQPVLMRKHLSGFRDEIRRFAGERRDIVDQAALLWTALYTVVDEYRSSHDDWLFLRHEDVARAPVPAFRTIFEHVAVPFTKEIETRVRESTRASNPEDTDDPHSTVRDSRATIHRWKRELTPAEIERVRERVEPLSSRFYSAEDWEPRRRSEEASVDGS